MPQKTEKDLWVEMSIREISTQALFAEISYSHIEPKAAAGTDAVFSSIHSFLSHCVMVSKMLAAEDDGKPPKSIGGILGIPDASVIHQRRFRNHLEHYDERLKKWIGKFGVNRMIGTYNIGPKSMFQDPNMLFVSHYDSSSQVFTFVNEDFDLGNLSEELKRIKENADKWVKKMEQGAITPPFI
jgi:hypothetical protein